MFVIGTAGHVDHGKSTLVRAITGIDPDRLQEEKDRGMTIDLGFAWFSLPGGQEISIVDVPGHEKFVNNMLAGVGGIDLAMLVVAADEGVMPQTREHLAILDLLQVPGGLVVISKTDLVDDEWLDLVKMDIYELTEGTVLEGSGVYPVSAEKGTGLEALTDAIDEMFTISINRSDSGRPRLPVDRVFTVAGFGTVVTGTLLDGSLNSGQEIEMTPSGQKGRIRGLQTHKKKENVVHPGTRVAANISGIDQDHITRGEVLTVPGWLRPSEAFDVKLHVLDEAPNLVQITPKKFLRAEAFPEILFKALQEKLMPAVGLFDEIWICAAEYNEDETSHLICLMGVQNSAQQAIVKSINEVLSFTDIDLGNIDVAHFSYDDEVCTKIREIGIKLQFPEVSEVKNAARDVKNKAALQPPKLR